MLSTTGVKINLNADHLPKLNPELVAIKYSDT
jgi:hypothetical protein